MILSLHPAQREIATDRHRFRVLVCGRKFGKTTLAVYEILGKAVAKSGRAVAYLASTYGEARDIAWETLKRIAQPVIIGQPNESRLEVEVKTQDGGKSIIYLKGWESVETMRGMEFDLLVPDEIQNYRNFWMEWQEVLRPTLTPRKGEAFFAGTPKGFNHLYDLFNKEKTDSDFKSFHYTSFDNPFLPVEEIEKAREELTEDRFAQEYLADFRKTEGLVYKEFNRKKHLYDQLPDITIIDRLLGVDFGFTNPTAVLLILQDTQGNYWAESEWYKTGQTNDQIIETIQSFKAHKVYPDPEAPERIVEMERAGINCMEVIKGKDSIKNGITRVRELFKQGRLNINSHCTNLIWELETYSYPEKRPDNPNPEIPIKENDHLLDGLRYVLQTHNTLNTNQDIYVPVFDTN